MLNPLLLANVRASRIFLVMVAVISCISCQPKKELQLSGQTMGTTYHIKMVAGLFDDKADLKKKIDDCLVQINKSMSTYDPNSEISRFNAMDAIDSSFSPSDDFLTVLHVAAEVYRLTDGAWDGTLDPLINLWGFGRKGIFDRIPADEEIKSALEKVGFDRIRFDPSGNIGKNHPDVTLDLASIAKGYGVDEIARLLGKNDYADFLVEIGGEVYARGYRKDGNPWRVGINRPERDASFTDVYRSVSLTDRAMATSGDYRIFFTVNGQYYSHILDPRTGRPVTNGVVSATVVAANCTVADALATALMVMGPEKGISLINRLPSVECLLVVRRPDGTLKDYPSDGFR